MRLVCFCVPARQDMHELRCNAWTVRQSTNLWGAAEPPEGAPPQVGLFLMYGALFGLVRTDCDDRIATRFGPVLDDVERTVRVFDRDRRIARYVRFAVAKLKKAGAFVKQGGGVSALFPTHEAHTAAKEWQIKRLESEFPSLITLKTGDINAMSAPFRFARAANVLVAESDQEPE